MLLTELHLRLLNAKLSSKLILFVFLLPLLSFGQVTEGTTTYIVSENANLKKEAYSGSFYYIQAGFSIPITVNNEKNVSNYNEDTDSNDSFWDQFTIDGVSIDAGAGIHWKKWIAVGLHTGFDVRIKAKLAAVPVYGVVTLNPHFNGDSSFLLQYGYGHIFALGRGNLSGPYSKYKFGVHIDNNILIFAEVNVIDFPIYNFNKIESFNIGINLLEFF